MNISEIQSRKIDVLGVQAFIAIGEAGSFQKAADSLFITQTALTRRLQNLENFLGVKLVERTTRSVGLTIIGGDFLPHARRLLTELSMALLEIRETGKVQRGDVTIACVPTVAYHFLPAVIQEYSAQHPNNRIKVLDHTSSGVADAVLRREAEFGINVAGIQHSDLSSTSLLDDSFVLVCRDDHPLAKKKTITWKQLEPHPLILLGQFSGNRPLLDLGLGGTNLKLTSFFEVQRVATALGLVAEGMGAAVLPWLSIPREAYPRIRVIHLTHPLISRTLTLVTRKPSALSPAARALYEMLHAAARKK
jgi:DNA-binding transcriptional LysR family regulator